LLAEELALKFCMLVFYLLVFKIQKVQQIKILPLFFVSQKFVQLFPSFAYQRQQHHIFSNAVFDLRGIDGFIAELLPKLVVLLAKDD